MTDSVLHNRIAESQGLETAVVLAVPGQTATPGSAGRSADAVRYPLSDGREGMGKNKGLHL